MRKRRGRPPKLTPKVVYDLTRLLALGAPRRDACRHAKVGYSTFKAWMALGRDSPRSVAFSPSTGPVGEDGKPIWLYDRAFTFGDFRARIQEADSGLVIRALASLSKNLASDGRLALMVLERKRPEEYGRREVISATATALPGMPPGARVTTPKGGYKLTLEVVRPDETTMHDPTPGSEE